VSQKKVPTSKLFVTLSNLNGLWNILQCWKAHGICYKTKWHYPPHLRYIATLPWETKNSNFLHIFNRYRSKYEQTNCICALILIPLRM